MWTWLKKINWAKLGHRVPIVLSLLLLSSGGTGLYLELHNRYYRAAPSPFLMPGIGAILIGLFCLTKNRYAFITLSLATLVYCIFGLNYGFINSSGVHHVHYYASWKLRSANGELILQDPLGQYPPATGAYVTCHFLLKDWRSYLDDQPTLCTALTAEQNIEMTFENQHEKVGLVRLVQINQFRSQRKSLLGEPIDRSALRLKYLEKAGWFGSSFVLQEIYEVYEQKISPEDTRVVETFWREADGRLKSFTESSLLNLSSEGIYANYNGKGVLTALPPTLNNSFAFPATIDVRNYLQLKLPKYIKAGALLQ